MFEQALIIEAPGTKRFWTTCVGVTGQVALVAAMILAPMVWPEALPKPTAILTLLLPATPLPPAAAAPVTQMHRTVDHRSIMNLDGTVNVPVRVPATIARIVDEAPPEMGGGGVLGGTGVPGAMGVPGAVASIFTGAVLAPPRLAEVARPIERPPVAVDPVRLKIGGVVLAGKLASRVDPVYPTLAKQMRVQGVVELIATVGVDGRVKEVRMVSGNPLLAPAAVDAVKRWIYRPTYLNGDAVEVIAPVTVTFHLN